MAEQKRAFKGVWIPAHIWLNEKLSLQEKIILAEVDSFCSRYTSCYVSNEHLAKFIGVSTRRIQEILKCLEEKGFIQRTMKHKSKSKEIERRYLRVVYEESCAQGGEESCAENNTVTFMSNTVVSSTVTDRRTDELQPLIDFCNNNVEILTPYKLQMLEGYVIDFGIEWVQKGLEKLAGLDRCKQNMKYLGGVLDGWKKDGVPKPWEQKKHEPDDDYDPDNRASLWISG